MSLEWSSRLEEIRDIFEEELNKPLDSDTATRAMKSGALKVLHSRQNLARRNIDQGIADRTLPASARYEHPISIGGVATTKGEALRSGRYDVIEKRANAKAKAAETLDKEARLDHQMVIRHLKAELSAIKSRR